jgi:hypothetical protein
MAGYTRQKSAEIVTGAVARASDIAAEFDQVQSAFNSSTGHTHSGTSGEGAPITVVGPAQDLIVSTTIARPKTDNVMDLGSATYEFKDGYFDGKLYTDAINLDGTDITATAAELNILDGVTASAAELNILDGVTATTAELNILDGVTSTAAELNILDGATVTVSELNILDGATLTTTELNYVDGVTSAIQTQLDTKTEDADIPALVAGITAGTVGSLMWASCTATTVAYGATVLGSTLTPSGFSQDNGLSERADIGSSGSAPLGTWRCLGYLSGAKNVNATLFMRIS